MGNKEITIKKVWFDSERIYILTSDGKQGSHPLSWFSRLENATDKERNQYSTSPFGIHWPHLDEDLSIDGFFNYTPVAMKSK